MIPLLRIAVDVISLYMLVIVAGVVLSWLFAFNVVNRRNQYVSQAASIIASLTEPPLRFIRNFLPRSGGLDLSPLVFILLLLYVQDVLRVGGGLLAAETTPPYWPLALIFLPLLALLLKIITLFMWIVVIDAVLSWLIAFNIVNRGNAVVYMLSSATGMLVDPVLNPIRRKLPDIGGVDVSPIILFFGLMFVRDVLLGKVGEGLMKLLAQ